MSFLKLTDILKQAQNRFPHLAKRLDEAEALGRWALAVGPMIAKHSRALRVESGVLWVEVDHPIWKSELHHRKRQILDILNQNGGKVVKTQGAAITPALPPLNDLLFLDPRTRRSL